MSSKPITSDYLKHLLKNGHLVFTRSKALFPKSKLALGFKAAKWKDDDSVVEGWLMCSICEEWLKTPHSQGTNVLKRHIQKCKFDGYALLDPANLAKLVASCLRLGGLKVKTDDLKKSFENYSMITKDVV